MATNNAINLTASGLVAYNGTGTFSGRTLTATSSKIAIVNGDGTGGNPGVDVTEANLTLDNIGGTLSVNKGGTGVASLTAYAVICGGTTGTGNVQSIASVGSSGQVLTSNGAGALPTFQAASGGGLSWVVETTTSRSAAVNEGVICNNASLVTVTLPDTAAVGDKLRVTGIGAGGWLIAQNASELIHFGNTVTTTGAGGSLASTDDNDAVELVCVVANTEWLVLSSVGNITVV